MTGPRPQPHNNKTYVIIALHANTGTTQIFGNKDGNPFKTEQAVNEKVLKLRGDHPHLSFFAAPISRISAINTLSRVMPQQGSKNNGSNR